MKESISESFNRIQWHDSKLRSLRVLRRDAMDEVILDVELRGASEQELTPMAVVLEDAIFLFSDLDLQGKRECADDISSAKCDTKTDFMTKLQFKRLNNSPAALAGYFHFSVYLIPPGGTVDIIASGFRLEGPDREALHPFSNR